MFLNSSTLWNEKEVDGTTEKRQGASAVTQKVFRLLTFLCGMTCGMYCSNSWALFLPFSSSWNKRLGFRSLKVRWGLKGEQKADVFTVSTALPCLYLLAQPVVIGGEASPAVPFIKHHQPAMNTVEQLQFFTLSVFCSTQNPFGQYKYPLPLCIISVSLHTHLGCHPKSSCTRMCSEMRRWWWVLRSWKMFALHRLQCHQGFCKTSTVSGSCSVTGNGNQHNIVAGITWRGGVSSHKRAWA